MKTLRLLALLLCSLAPLLHAQTGLTRLGEFKVNATTANAQIDSAIAGDAAGNFVVVWTTVTGGGGQDIVGQRYNVAGSPVGGEFPVNTATKANQVTPAVACAPDGRFVVVWQSDGAPAEAGLFARIFAADGTGGAQFPIPGTSGASVGRYPAIAMDSDANFVVAWAGDGRNGDSSLVSNIYALRYTKTGSVIGTELSVNTSFAGDQTLPSIARQGNGDFVVTWRHSPDANPSHIEINGRRYDNNGNPKLTAGLPNEFTVNLVTANAQTYASVAVNDAGQFVVAYDSEFVDGDSYGILARLFDAAGNGGAEVPVNTVQAGSQSVPSVAMRASGEFAVAWQSENLDGSSKGIALRRFASDGTPIEAEDIKANSFPTGIQSTAATGAGRTLVFDAGGNVTVVWQSGDQDGSDFGIFADKFYLPNQGPPLDEFRVNTTTTGNQDSAVVAMNGSGNTVVVWRGKTPSNRDGLFFQRYNASGVRVGLETPANAATVGDQFNPAVAMASNGDFVVVWETTATGDEDVYAQRFNVQGQAQGNEFRVNTTISSNQGFPAVGMDGVGNFAVAWVSVGQGGDGAGGIYFQRFTAGGSAIGGEVHVNLTTQFDETLPIVAMNSSGEFNVVWRGGGDAGDSAVYCRRYFSDGSPKGGEFLVNVSTVHSEGYGSIALLDNRHFIITYHRQYVPGNADYDVFARIYTTDANDNVTAGNELSVNQGTAGRQFYPSISATQNGAFRIAWISDSSDGSPEGVAQRAFDSNGTPLGAETPVNLFTTGEQSLNSAGRALAIDGSGNYFLVWQSDQQDGSGAGIYATKVFVNPPPKQIAPTPIAAGSRRALRVHTFGDVQPQWRLVGDVEWVKDGALRAGLLPGEYTIEFEPQVGYTVPVGETVMIGETSPDPVPRDYPALPATGSANGFLLVTIEPEAVATKRAIQERGQWRFLGESDAQWRNSSLSPLTLPVGSYILEFKQVDLLVRVPNRLVQVVPSKPTQPTRVRAFYEPIPAAARGVPPELLSFAEATGTAPFCFAGQFRSDAGFGSGMVVQPRVVLTFTTGLRWSFRRVRGESEPLPLTPRGSYVFGSYAAIRQAALLLPGAVPGESDQPAQQRDVAAVYFPVDAGDRGYTEVLKTTEDAGNNWLEQGRLATLVSYPVDPGFVNDGDAGKMFRTPPTEAAFTPVAALPLPGGVTDDGKGVKNRVFSTTDLAGYPGSSGGAICVQFDDGKYYPAAVYLAGGDRSVVRAIDADVVNLIAQAADSSINPDHNNTSGGITLVSTPIAAGTFFVANLKVNIVLPPGIAGPGQWKVKGALHNNGDVVPFNSAGKHTVTFTGVDGTLPPKPYEVNFTGYDELTITGTYVDDRAPLITTRELLRGVEDRPYAKLQLATAAPAKSFQSSDLEALGLRINDRGVISGQPLPKTTGRFDVAITATGATGRTATRNFKLTIVPLGLLAVEKEGRGRVLGDRDEIPQGDSVMLKAVPGEGYLFLRWSGAGIVGVPTANPRLKFTMPASVALKAEFVTNPFLQNAGTYRGRLSGESASFRRTGLASFTVTKTGGFTGRFTVGGQDYPLSGRFKLDGSFRGKVGPKNAPFAVELNLDLVTGIPPTLPDQRALTGALTVAANDALTFTAYRAASPANTETRYTLELPSDPALTAPTYPQGSSVATILASKQRRVRAMFSMADGAKGSAGGFITAPPGLLERWTLFAPLYDGADAVVGDLDFVAGTISGEARWFRTKVVWPDGGLVSAVHGVAYQVLRPGGGLNEPQGPLDAFGSATTRLPVTLVFSNAALPAQSAELTIGGVFRIPADNSTQLRLTLDAETGLFTGSFLPDALGKHRVTGVLLQPENKGVGFILEPAASSAVTLDVEP